MPKSYVGTQQRLAHRNSEDSEKVSVRFNNASFGNGFEWLDWFGGGSIL